jgi:hypothetical protein
VKINQSDFSLNNNMNQQWQVQNAPMP